MGFFSRVIQYFLFKGKSRQITSEPSRVRENKSLLIDTPACTYCSEFDPYNSQAANPICMKCKGNPAGLFSA